MSSTFHAEPYLSWGRVQRGDHLVARPQHRAELPGLLAEAASSTVLGGGLSRSYGDSGLDSDGRLISGRDLNRFISLDLETGILRGEAGLSLGEILQVSVPRGWFLPTTPGTRFVTLAGAVANDVHGKNHHVAGSLGCHVRKIGLIRSDRGRLELSPETEKALFEATLGGLGLTGFIEWVELQLVPVPSGFLDQEAVGFSGIDGYFDLLEDSHQRFEHVAAWIDCAATGRKLGRGVLFRANWSREGGWLAHSPRPKLSVPFEAPGWLLNPLSIKTFNVAYNDLYSSRPGIQRVAYASAFYPLDAIGGWNKLYGSRGFFQHQSVIPPGTERETLRKMLEAISASGQGSFLAVLKTMGDKRSAGVVSFPMAGASLALDFPNRGASTLALLERLDGLVSEADGRVYPAKDSRMSAAVFQKGFPRWNDLEALRDPLFLSAFWRRVTT